MVGERQFAIFLPIMLYRALKFIIGIGMRLYYREIRVKHQERLQHDGPKIILANHPNTLMDAWMVGHVYSEQIFYMAKATFFNTRFKMWLLKSLGMIPINRATESKTRNVSNTDSFEACYKLLEEGKSLVIFPEGNSYNERQLRDLKSGAARIALEAERRNGGKLNIRIIPIGLVYAEPEKFRSSVLINVGEQIDPRPYVNDFENDSLKTARILTDRFKGAMVDLLVGAHTAEYDELANYISKILSSDYIPSEEKGVEKDVQRLKQIFQGIHRLQITDPDGLNRVRDLTNKIDFQLNSMEIKSDFLDRKFKPRMFVRQLFFSTIFLLLGLPFYLFGILHNFMQYFLIDQLLMRVVKEREYYAAIAVLLSIVVYPLTYWGFLELLTYFVHLAFGFKVIYLFSMLFLGLFAYFFHKYLVHVISKINFIVSMILERDRIERLKQDREELKNLLLND